MTELLSIALPFVVALGSGALAYIVAKARTEAALAREREQLTEVRSQLVQQHRASEERIRAAQAEARCRALDEFLADVRVEERQYLKELDDSSERKKCLVLQERVCFRNIPLSQWTERELAFEQGEALRGPLRPEAVGEALPSPHRSRRPQLLR